MRTRLPLYLVETILLLSLVSGHDPLPDLHTAPTSPASTSSIVLPGEPGRTSLTLWDVGFSLREQWLDLRSEEECPAPAQLLPVDPGADPGDQLLLESVASALHPSSSAAEIPPAATATAEPSGNDFVSFEDWKKLQEAGQEADEHTPPFENSQEQAHPDSPELQEHKSIHNGSDGVPSDNHSGQAPASPDAIPKKPSNDAPLHRKFNYASPDCSARVHTSAPQTQHASSLLHKSKDRYMLTPCKAEHWVVVELCDSIRSTSIELASYEFFSGIVKDVKISISEDEVETGSDGWEEVGVFVADNVRGAQTFTLPRPTAFHRFIRLDFLSFYGSEYYCPVTQLKVFGMNQMEAFRWEQKLLEADTKEREKARTAVREKEEEETRIRESQKREASEAHAKAEEQHRESELDQLERLLAQQAMRGIQDLPDLMTEAGLLPQVTGSRPETSSTFASPQASAPPTNHSSSAEFNLSTSEGSTVNNNEKTPNVANETTTTTQSLFRGNTSSTASPSRSASVKSESSESIYAFIIRRLNALEGNSSLVARYIEEQSRVMRLSLGKLERGWDEWRLNSEREESQRWEQKRMRQEDRLGRVISSLEQQRVAFEHDRQAMTTQMRILTEELGYERKRGLAQLLLTLFIIVLGALSRSDTINSALRPLVTEARRRRNSFARRSVYGPLSGLRIDLGKERPAAIIGQRRPSPPTALDLTPSPGPISPTPTKAKGGFAKSVSVSKRTGSAYNPLRQRRQPSIGLTTFRPNSMIDTTSVATREKSPLSTNASRVPDALFTARPRISQPPQRHASGVPTRKLARSAHLHAVQGDRRRDVSTTNLPDTLTAQSPLHALLAMGQASEAVGSANKTDPSGVAVTSEEYPDWRTDGGSDAASASDAEQALDEALSPALTSDDPQLVAELKQIWTAG